LNSLEIAQSRESPPTGSPVTFHDLLPEEPPISLLALLNIMLRHRRMLLLCGLLAAVLVDLPVLLTQRMYTSDASFMPQQNAPSNVEGLATQIGISLPTAQDGTQLYADLLRSRGVLRTVAEAPYTFATPEGRRTESLVQLYGEGASPQERTASALRKLNSLVTTTVSPKTAVITLKVSAPYPELARDVSLRLIDELNRFNLERRQSQAGAERKFAETRLADAQAELRRAENELETFLAQNREYRSSPHLSFQADRLTREVSLRQGVFNVISQTYEQSKMDEVRDTPVITVIDKPETPLIPDSRGLVITTILGFFLGVGLAMVVAFVGDYFRRKGRSGSDELSELAQLRSEIRYDFRHAWWVVSHLFRRKKVA
jgi:uncharacterized protein involved in exopolysaccharide biosynthesis